MVIGFTGESVLLVGRGGGGGPTVVEGSCVSWEVEHLCDRKGGYQMAEKGIPPVEEEEAEYVLMGGGGGGGWGGGWCRGGHGGGGFICFLGRGGIVLVRGGVCRCLWTEVLPCWCEEVCAVLYTLVYHKASVLSPFRWFCCSCSSEVVFLSRVGGSSFGSYSFQFHHFRAYGGEGCSCPLSLVQRSRRVAGPLVWCSLCIFWSL
jgi:hypothetical protein